MKPAAIVRRAPVVARVVSSPALELAALQAEAPAARPKVALAGELVRVGGQLLDQVEAVRLWAELGAVLGLAERERRPVAWSFLVDWLDRCFLEAVPVQVQEGPARLEGLAIRVLEDRALVRVGPFAVAHLRLRTTPSSRTWTGPVAYYWPGALGTDPRNPDPHLGFTRRTIRASRQVLELAPLVTR